MRTNQFGQPIGPSLTDWAPPSPPSRETLRGRFCRLEPLEPHVHAHDLYVADRTDADGRSWTYLPYGPFESFKDYEQWLEEVCTGSDPLFFAILDESDRAVGVASFLNIRPLGGTIEVGHLHFSALLRRRPAATEALFLLMKHAFELGYRRCEWKCDALNAASRAAALRLGLSLEGIFRNATVYKERSRDTAWFAAIDSEWPALQQAFTHWLAPSNFDAQGNQRSRLSELTRSALLAMGR